MGGRRLNEVAGCVGNGSLIRHDEGIGHSAMGHMGESKRAARSFLYVLEFAC